MPLLEASKNHRKLRKITPSGMVFVDFDTKPGHLSENHTYMRLKNTQVWFIPKNNHRTRLHTSVDGLLHVSRVLKSHTYHRKIKSFFLIFVHVLGVLNDFMRVLLFVVFFTLVAE